ncbi:MAG: hypothetical protein KatS3mg109_0502 [Pirellulaceae bacterium]|nr:MAG: hypothetical protein KatS3mg109_0502 [Pirellulaceae bacterium]
MLLRWLVANYYRQVADQLWEGVTSTASQLLHGPAEQVVPPAHFRSVLVTGVKWEAGPILRALEPVVSARYEEGHEHWGIYRNVPVRVVETGMGPQLAARATRALVSRCRPERVLAIGFAAALTDRIPVGSVVVPARVLDSEGNEIPWTPADWPLTEQLPVASAAMVSLDRVLTSAQQRQAVAERFAAEVADQETAAILRVCAELGIPCHAVKVVTDAWDDPLPQEVRRWLKQKSWAGKLGVLAGALIYRREELGELWRLKERAAVCSQRLADALGFTGTPPPQAPGSPQAEGGQA